MLTRNRRWLFSVLVLVVVAVASSWTQDGVTLRVGDPAPQFHAEVFGQPGDVFDLAAFRGRVVVLDFWATWCSPCVASIPHLNDLVGRFAGKGVAFVAVTDDEEDRLTRFLKDKPIKGTVIRDREGELFKRFGVVGRPHTVVIGPSGDIAAITLPESVTEQALNVFLASGTANFEAKEIKAENVDWDNEEIEWKDGAKPDLQVIIKPIRVATSAVYYRPGSNRLTADGVTLQVLLPIAYSTDDLHVDWRRRHPENTYRVSVIVPRGQEPALLSLLQAGISAHSGIVTRWEEREMDVYLLKITPEAKPFTPSVVGDGKEVFYSMRGKSHAVRQPMSMLVTDLTNHLRRIVIDETGLVGRYDWDLPYQPGQPDVIIRSLGKLGLEVVVARRSVKMLVVE